MNDNAYQHMAFESRRKGTLTAYLLYFLLGVFGIHLLYVKQPIRWAIVFVLMPIVFFLCAVGAANQPVICWLCLIVIILSQVYDLFTLWSQVEDANRDLMVELLENS